MIRMNKPKGGEPNIWLVVHGGFDFDPTILAVCSSETKAKEMIAEHYRNPEHQDYVWNGCCVISATIDDWIDYGRKAEIASTQEALAKLEGLVDRKSDNADKEE